MFKHQNSIIMYTQNFGNPAAFTVMGLQERNHLAEQTIQEYVAKHGTMDIAIGLVGMIPGAAIPALMAAIAAQGPAIYQPMSRKLAAIYLASPDELNYVNDDIVATGNVADATLSIAAEFGTGFLKEIAGEIIAEVGVGVLASLIPFVGGIIAAGIDYKVASIMTNRVGRMVSAYYQNGARWLGSKSSTYEASKDMSSDLDDIRRDNPQVLRALLSQVHTLIKMMRTGGSNKQQTIDGLRSQQVPEDLIKEAMASYDWHNDNEKRA
jgi:hypothetical protein